MYFLSTTFSLDSISILEDSSQDIIIQSHSDVSTLQEENKPLMASRNEKSSWENIFHDAFSVCKALYRY